MAKMTCKGDVEYCIPNKKRPIAYSTKTASDFLKIMHQDGYDTPNKIIDLINSRYQLAFEEKEIMQTYVDLGYGNLKLDLA